MNDKADEEAWQFDADPFDGVCDRCGEETTVIRAVDPYAEMMDEDDAKKHVTQRWCRPCWMQRCMDR